MLGVFLNKYVYPHSCCPYLHVLLKNGPYFHVFTIKRGQIQGLNLKGPYSFILILIVHGFDENDPYLRVFT